MADDGIKLTKEEREHLQAVIMTFGDADKWTALVAAVESIVAARVQALTAERDELRESLPKKTNAWLAHCKRLDAERDAVSDQLAKAWKELGEAEAENAALSARLERVRALADEWEAMTDPVFTPKYRANALRAALGEDA